MALRSRVRVSLRAAVAAACMFVLLTVSQSAVAAPGAEPVALAIERVQAVVDRLREQLGIPERVRVTVLPRVSLIVSVEAPVDEGQPYRLAIEDTFLARLSPDEVSAAVAHELGHVWVFTHHPYLQTERLANQIAMRVVSRESLERVYHKLWEHGGTRGDLTAFLGP